MVVVGGRQLVKCDNVIISSCTGTALAMVNEQTDKLQKIFRGIAGRAFSSLQEKKVTVDVFVINLVNTPVEHRNMHKEFFDMVIIELCKEPSLLKVWFSLSQYWNFLSYSLLEQVVCDYGDEDLKTDMEDYIKELKEFRCRTRLCDFAKYSVKINEDLSEQNLKDLTIKYHQSWDECTLEYLENFSEKISQKFFLPSFSLVLQDIKLGCISVTWAVPEMIAVSFKENIENSDMGEFCKEHGIMAISIDGQECKYSPVQKYSAYLKDLYSHKEGKNLAPFKLAGIEKKKVERRQLDKFSRSTLRGDQDDVVYSKHHMDQDQIGHPTWPEKKQPRLILIEGAPGVGKTTFSDQFCYEWSQGKLLSHHKLLILLPLRDNRVKSARNVSDLFQHPQLQQEIAEEVKSSGGEGVALWLEAWDELEEETRKKSSIFLDLVQGHVLPKATVIITSRPWATQNMHSGGNIDQHIEIVSTPKIQFSRVLTGDKVRSDIRDKFIDYVNLNHSVKAAMHTPVTADIVAEVFQWSRDFESPPSTTLTQLYTAFTCKLLMQNLSSRKGEGRKSWKIRSLEEVPADVKEGLLRMCRLAWEGVVEQQLTFDSDVVGGDTLGLVHGVRELYGGEDGQLSYHFIHLTLQEFLSAYHITQLPQRNQEQIIRKHVDTGHLNIVVRFYFGLTKPNHFTSRMISEHTPDRRQATAYHWLFECGDVETISVKLREVSVRSSYWWNPLDYYVLGYCVSHYEFQWKLDLSYASMEDEDIEMLCRGMASAPDTTWNGELEADFSGNNVTSEGMKWFTKIPLQLLQQIKKPAFNFNKLDSNALDVFTKIVPNLSKLQALSLNGNPIGKGGAVEVLKCLYHHKIPLEKLNLQYTGVGEEDCALIALLTRTLLNLNISRNSLSSNSIATIMEGLLQHNIIQTLEMSHSHLSEENCLSLGTLLQQSECQLRALWITKCDICGEGAVHLGTGLTNNHSLTALYISDNPIGDIGAAALGDMIRSNTVLTKLSMAKCGITSEGCVQLAAGLIENTTIQDLSLLYNHVGVEGARAISEVIEKNKTLHMLWLYGDESLEEGVDSIIHSLQNNTTLQRVTLSSKYRHHDTVGLRNLRECIIAIDMRQELAWHVHCAHVWQELAWRVHCAHAWQELAWRVHCAHAWQELAWRVHCAHAWQELAWRVHCAHAWQELAWRVHCAHAWQELAWRVHCAHAWQELAWRVHCAHAWQELAWRVHCAHAWQELAWRVHCAHAWQGLAWRVHCGRSWPGVFTVHTRGGSWPGVFTVHTRGGNWPGVFTVHTHGRRVHCARAWQELVWRVHCAHTWQELVWRVHCAHMWQEAGAGLACSLCTRVPGAGLACSLCTRVAGAGLACSLRTRVAGAGLACSLRTRVAGAGLACSLSTRVAGAGLACSLCTRVAGAGLACSLCTRVAEACLACSLCTRESGAGLACSLCTRESGAGLACSLCTRVAGAGPTCSLCTRESGAGLACSLCTRVGGAGLACSLCTRVAGAGLACLLCTRVGGDGLACSLCTRVGGDGLGCSLCTHVGGRVFLLCICRR